MKWYKHDPSAALAGMIGLTIEERGAYYTLIDLQYARAPHNDVTDELMMHALGCRPQIWRRLKASLVDKGKVHETAGKLTANRVQTEVQTALKLMVQTEVCRGVSGTSNEQNQELKPSASRLYARARQPHPHPDLNLSSAASSESSRSARTEKIIPAKTETSKMPKKEKQDFKNKKGLFDLASHHEQSLPASTPAKQQHQPKWPNSFPTQPLAEAAINPKRQAARVAWEAELGRCLGPDHYATAIDLLAGNPVLAERATNAELRKAGSGAMAAMVALRKLNGIGPPS